MANVKFKYSDSSKTVVTGLSLFSRNATEIVIPDGATAIGKGAFKDYKKLQTVHIPDSVTSIGDRAFDGCWQLTSVRLPKSVTYIGSEAFSLCNHLTSVKLPDSVTTISSFAFSHGGLKSITIPDSVTSIGSYAFSHCGRLTSAYLSSELAQKYADRFPQKCKLFPLDTEALLTCKPNADGGRTLLRAAVQGYTALVLPEDITVIGNGAFASSMQLKEIVLPKGLTAIGDDAFYGCANLKQIDLPEGLTAIGDNAFAGCTALEDTTLPDSLTTLGMGAFAGCTFRRLTLSAALPDSVRGALPAGKEHFFTAPISFFEHTRHADGTYTIGKPQHTDFSILQIPEGVSVIDSYAFANCEKLSAVVLPDSLAQIRFYAFSSCGLTSVTLPDGIVKIGENAFEDCKQLTAVSLPEGDVDIVRETYGKGFTVPLGTFPSGCSITRRPVKTPRAEENTGPLAAFYHRKNVDGTYTVFGAKDKAAKELVIPWGVTEISAEAFDGCQDLVSVTIPASVTRIGAMAFSLCRNLAAITVPDSVTSIGEKAFYCCGLTAVTLPDSVTSIGYWAFRGCKKLTSITIPDSVTSIGDYAFYGCSSLTSITIPSGVTSIGYAAFSGCTGLTSIKIPASVASIGKYAFHHCDKLTDIAVENGNALYHSSGNCLIKTAKKELIRGSSDSVIPADGSVVHIANSAFEGCNSLISVTVPNSVESIGTSAFAHCSGLVSVTIPASVTRIKDQAFADTALKTVNLPNKQIKIGKDVFPPACKITRGSVAGQKTGN